MPRRPPPTSIVRSHPTPYEVLDVAESASEEEIKRSFRKLALRLHPDKAKHPQAPEAFTAIEAAWQKLRPAA